MKKKLCLIVLTAGLTLGIAAPSQAASVSPSILDFGTFSVTSPPSGLLSATVTSGGAHPYFAGVEMLSGKPYFFPSSTCPEAKENFAPCPVNVRVVTPITATGPLTGVIGVKFGDGSSEGAEAKETLQVEVRANVTAAAAIVPPVVITPPAPTPPTTGTTTKPKPKKKACKKGGAKSSAAKKGGKGCGGAKKGKGNKGKGKGR